MGKSKKYTLMMEGNYRPYMFFWYVMMVMMVMTVTLMSCSSTSSSEIELKKSDHIMMIGGNLCSRMMNYGFLEAGLQASFPSHELYIRNMCDGGDTPGFRPHSGRNTPWAFDGAEAYQDEYANPSRSAGHYEYPDEWLSRHGADIILGYFGYSESWEGEEGLDLFEEELVAFIDHTLAQKYNDSTPPELVLITPTPFEDLSSKLDVPRGEDINKRLALYTGAILSVAESKSVKVFDLFSASRSSFAKADQLTIDGLQLNEKGYELVTGLILDHVFGVSPTYSERSMEPVLDAVNEKNWYWHNDFKSPNGVHVFGRRYDPYGPDNYPYELEKLRELTAIRDSMIWAVVQGEDFDLESADQRTRALPEVKTNFSTKENSGNGAIFYRYGDDALATLSVPQGYQIELFASEEEFEDLANPVQLSFDNRGRLWVATMPTYPHWKPGESMPDDKLIILEDRDGDGKADHQITFAEGLHIPVGFEFASDGVYVSQGTNLILLQDTDGDDVADHSEIVLSGFDDHDTHHTAGAFCADPSGAIYMGEGVFLHTNVETSYGTVRATNGGFYRYNPQRRHLERTAQLAIPNPWGIAFDDWGQPIFAETSGPDVRWMLPGTVKSRYGQATHKSKNLIEGEHRVRPTSGLEFVSSRHFPDEAQGDLLINNTIGFLGMKQHRFLDSSTGYITTHRQDLVVGDDPNFRPVDMEFAPDGSLYLVDWHNVLIGHMQHNARDPLRDHKHGRVYRITYPSRPLITPAKIHGASIAELLDNLKLPEYRTRYRTRRELRGRDQKEVLAALDGWIDTLDREEEGYEHHLVEALWVSWGMNVAHEELINQLLQAEDYRARAAATRVIRYMGHQLSDRLALLKQAAADDHGRVRLEAIVAASWIPSEEGLEVLSTAGVHDMDEWIIHAYQTALSHLNNQNYETSEKKELMSNHLEGKEWALYEKGYEVYTRDGHCGTCHQADGQGLTASGFPPLEGTNWVLGDEERLIKLTLKGLHGPITVAGKDYPGLVPMTPFGGLLDDEEVAAVLTYIRNDWKNKAPVIHPDRVKAIRSAISSKQGFYTPTELLKEHPLEASL